jgi:AraC-like DNA-binding protein
VLALSLNLFNVFYIFIGALWLEGLVQEVANNFMWFVGPCLFLYLTYLPDQNNRRLFLKHLLPYIILSSIGIIDHNGNIPNYYAIIGLLQIGTYLIVSLRILIIRYDSNNIYYQWLLPIIIAFTALYFLNLFFVALTKSGIYPIPRIITLNLNLLHTIPIFILAYREMNSKESFGWKEQRYKSNQLDSSKSEEYLVQILYQLEQEYLYRDTNLTLNTISEKTGISTKYISQTINDKLSVSFPDLINKYRIEEVKKNLTNPEKRHLTILGIAQGAGFKSGGRFNTLFKQNTGLTPTAYYKKHAKS